MWLWILLLVLAGAAALRLFAGYPRLPRPFAVLAAREVAFVGAAADAVFPPGGEIEPSGREAGVPEYLDRYLDALPGRTRLLIRLLFLLLEQATLLFPAPRPGGWRRFSSLSRRQQLAYLEGWRRSRFYPRRVVFTSLRSLLTIAYLASRDVLQRVGLAPLAIPTPVLDADLLYPPVGQPRTAIPYAPEDRTAPSDGTPLDPVRDAAPRDPGDAAPRPVAAPARHRSDADGDPRAWPGEVRVHADYAGDFTDEADVVVVGSGPCGAVAAYELARAGRRVVLLEEGPPFTPRDFELDGGLAMTRTMREGGLRITAGFPLPTMQAIALGGGSLVNSAICLRAPDFVLAEWSTGHALERTARADLDPHYDAVEKFLGIAPTPEDVQGPRNLLFREACNALGYSSEPMARNVRGCRGSGECLTGCRSRAKQSMDLSYVPAAVREGARVLTSVRVQQVLAEGRRVTGVAGRVVAPFTGRPGARFRVNARAVVLAAGCMATPVLLRRSGDLANSSGQVGENLQFHPGVSVMGIFPDPIEPIFGATQGYQSFQFLREGFKLETLWAPPGVLAVRIPGFGHDLKRNLLDMHHAAIWDAFLSCKKSVGRVRPRRGSHEPNLFWRFHPDDARVLGRSVWILAEMLFAAGAAKILPAVHGVPDELHTLEEAEVLRRRALRATDMVPASTHAFGTTRMHGDPRRGVVDELGRCHDVENLWLVDTGIYPSSSGVNPMFTGMALARRAALALAERL